MNRTPERLAFLNSDSTCVLLGVQRNYGKTSFFPPRSFECVEIDKADTSDRETTQDML